MNFTFRILIFLLQYYSEFGIYCELNEAHSITYPLSIGSGEEELVVLRRALREVCTKINIMDDDAKQWRLSASPISAETWVQERSYLLQASFLDTNNIEQIMLIDKKTLEGKISAETVRFKHYLYINRFRI